MRNQGLGIRESGISRSGLQRDAYISRKESWLITLDKYYNHETTGIKDFRHYWTTRHFKRRVVGGLSWAAMINQTFYKRQPLIDCEAASQHYPTTGRENY